MHPALFSAAVLCLCPQPSEPPTATAELVPAKKVLFSLHPFAMGSNGILLTLSRFPDSSFICQVDVDGQGKAKSVTYVSGNKAFFSMLQSHLKRAGYINGNVCADQPWTIYVKTTNKPRIGLPEGASISLEFEFLTRPEPGPTPQSPVRS